MEVETRPYRWVDAQRTHRTCATCKEEKPLDAFSWANKKTGRRQSECRSCMSIRNKNWRDSNPPPSKEANREAVLKTRKKNPVGLLVRSAKYRARERGIPFELKVEDITVPEYCPVLGIKIKSHAGTGRHPTHEEKDHCPSIDRIDNSKGYTPDNIVVVSVRANRLKSDATIDELARVVSFYRGANGPDQGS